MHRFLAVFIAVSAAFAQEDELAAEMKRLLEVYALAEQNAADPVAPDQAFYQGAIPGLLRRLDPHSVFFDAGQFDQLRKLETSTSKGFGTVVSVLPGRVIVLQTMAGTPSARAGIMPGDEILMVNGYELSRLDMEQLVALLGHSRQQRAQLIVKRPGNARMLTLQLTPEELQSPSVERAFPLRPGVAYLRVASFDEKTGAQIREAIEKLGGRDLKGLVLDLRNNPGGILGAALETASLFLAPGATVVTVRGRSQPERVEKVPGKNEPYRFAVAVIINGKSASASEIVSGALQDHDRGVVVGEPSFGKGLVESVFPLSEGTGVALTTAMYYTPSGRSIQKPLDAARFALAPTTAQPKEPQSYKTAGGRVVTGGGGITPDETVFLESPSRLRAVLDASGSFTSFATEYLARNSVDERFEVASGLMDDFKVFLAQRSIQPSLAEWSREREFIRNRLKAEIFNQSLGVDKGDEVEAQRDPQILKALEAVLSGARPAQARR
jgi:carboxyl-terminal processing protease